MSHTFIARMKVFPEKIEQFIDTCERMEKAVSENDAKCQTVSCINFIVLEKKTPLQ